MSMDRSCYGMNLIGRGAAATVQSIIMLLKYNMMVKKNKMKRYNRMAAPHPSIPPVLPKEK